MQMVGFADQRRQATNILCPARKRVSNRRNGRSEEAWYRLFAGVWRIAKATQPPELRAARSAVYSIGRFTTEGLLSWVEVVR